MPLDPVALARDLCAIPSVTGDEAAVGAHIEGVLRGLGLTTERQSPEGARFNLLARTDEKPRVVLSTHMDTVPPHLPLREDETHLYGRGVCDAKGILACQIAAAAQLLEAGERRIGLLFTVDEEAGSLGARVANLHPMARECRYLINGEPTEGVLASGTKGSLRLSITTTGRAAHSAYPEAGESAIEALLDVLRAIRTHDWPSDAALGETTVNIGLISGGVAANVLAPDASAVLQMRLVTAPEPILEVLEALCGERCRVDVLTASAPIRLLVPDGFESAPVRYTTDIPYLTNWGRPLLYGPGSILVAHTDEERVEKRALTDATDGYVRLVRALLDLDAAA